MSTCALCCEEAKSWAVGLCDHPVCLTCSTRLRILCEQRECSVCRERLDRVIITDAKKPYSSLPCQGLKGDKKNGVFFEKTHLQEAYKSLQQNSCLKCRDKPIFRLFSQLRDHCRKTHGLYYCEICSESLKLFPYEFRLYTRQELVRHRREGDPGNSSYKGHPLCKFCDDRFLDNDTLHAHLRKVHFWCHFCEGEGKQDYYCNYLLLRNHFKLEHYLCEEGACQHEKYTSVFRNKLDIQAHRAKVHSGSVSKAEAKQMRQLEVGFTYTRSEEQRPVGGTSNGGGRSQWKHVQRGRGNRTRQCEELKLATAMSESLQPPQREHKSSPKQSKPPTADQPPHTHEQSTRMKPAQEGKHDVERKEEPAVVVPNAVAIQTRKPPGFEQARPISALNSDPENEWPDLTKLTVFQAPREQLQSNMKSAASVISPLINLSSYNPLEQSQFPPPANALPATNSESYNLPLNANVRWPPSSGINSTSHRISSHAMPPGFIAQDWQKIHQDQVYVCSGLVPANQAPSGSVPANQAYPTTSITVPNLSKRSKEEYVIDQVREALNYDREKFSQFRNLSGWYRNSEITAKDYVIHCRQLFGEGMWMVVGPQLAQVMPIESKRVELTQHLTTSSIFSATFPSAFPPLDAQSASTWSAHSLDTQQQSDIQQQSGWTSVKRGVPNWQSTLEYPTLQSSDVSQPWKTRVQV